MDENNRRLFVSCPLPLDVKTILGQFIDDLKKESLCEGNYVDPQKAHITLKFLGPIDENELPEITRSLKTIYHKKMLATVGPPQWFERNTHIQIIYVGIVCPELATLAEQIEGVLAPWVPRETRSFVSHVTIMRVKKINNQPALKDFLSTYQIDQRPFSIDSFDLMASELTPEGPEYTILQEFALAD